MNIVVIGTGYVGLVTGTCFAEMGNQVTCVDVDENKVAELNRGYVSIYEPGIEEMVMQNHAQGRLKFTTNLARAICSASVIFIAVGTPPGEDGSADLQHVLNVASSIGKYLNHYCVVVNKSTVPVGTAGRVQDMINRKLKARGLNIEFDVVSNPEFLKEGSAVEDFMRPDRIVVGADTNRATDIMRQLYASFTRNHERMLVMGVREAEMTKYAANAMLASKISFMNEIAQLCDSYNVDIEKVRHGIGSDSRIGFSFIYPGCGYGGSCFPKDVTALIHMAQASGFDPVVLKAVEQRNHAQKRRLFDMVVSHFGRDLEGRNFALWGLAFKPGTDDIRQASSLVLLEQLIMAGAMVKVYDPVAHDSCRQVVPGEWIASGRLRFMRDEYHAVECVDAMLLVTEWKQFRNPDFDQLRSEMRGHVIFDGRNQYDPQSLAELGFYYYSIGRPTYLPRKSTVETSTAA
ncbi:MAG: UDP-glucose/GDP-mannose dehydrogenase family protein [Granulosicoccaceae bacterium]|jgi:UDPglucose 6-dehydrogenase